MSITVLVLLAAACAEERAAPVAGDAPPAAASATGAESTPAPGEAWNMRLVGRHHLQARSAYQPVVQRYGDRYVLFVGHHAGEAVNDATGATEVNGLSILDVTDPSAPTLLVHLPPRGAASGTQHVQVCAGSVLPDADPAKTYLVRTNGALAYDLYDVTDPAAPAYLSTIAETGRSSRPESARGDRETHKLQWECATGIGYFNGTAAGWRVTRVLQAFDLSDPEVPRHIRDFGLVGHEPGAAGPFPAPEVSGLHQAYAHGDRIYLGYGSGNDGTLQILDKQRFLNGSPDASDPFAPTPENLTYPELARLDLPSYWGVHTAKPALGIEVPGYAHAGRIRDFLIAPSEAEPDSMLCLGVRDVVFIVDITDVARPYPVATFQVPPEPGDYCNRGGRFGPHSVHDALDPRFDRTLALVAYFNAGIRAVDIRNPFAPVEVAYYVPETTERTIELCTQTDAGRVCKTAIQTNNVNIDDRGYIYAVDRSHTGLHVVELTGQARELVGLDPAR